MRDIIAAKYRAGVAPQRSASGGDLVYTSVVQAVGPGNWWAEIIWHCEHRHQKTETARACAERFVGRLIDGACLHGCHFWHATPEQNPREHCPECLLVPYRLLGGVRV